MLDALIILINSIKGKTDTLEADAHQILLHSRFLKKDQCCFILQDLNAGKIHNKNLASVNYILIY